ncbi:MAG: FAD-binding oxidoreductase [Pseudomonadota bacterium]
MVIADIAVIGAGMAGAGVAAELAPHARLVLIERESQPGYHTTGRSAAVFAESYGPAPIRALTRASAAFFEAPPAGFGPLLSPRGILMIARADQDAALADLIAEVSADLDVARLDAAALRARHPLLRPGYAVAGMEDPRGRDIDVAALHQGYLRALRSAGGTLVTRAEVTGLARRADAWRVETTAGPLAAGIVVNAAGAWADLLGQMAGALRIGLQPKRRTALIVPAPVGIDPAAWPITVDVEEQFYMKPDAGRLLISPADETPSPPCDAQPEEIDIALAVDRVQRAFDLPVRRIETKWAGLRSFVTDKAPVCGFDPQAEGFFWLAGQGGYGIQTAPALSRLAACLLRGQDMPADIAAEGVRLDQLAPDRPSIAPVDAAIAPPVGAG